MTSHKTQLVLNKQSIILASDYARSGMFHSDPEQIGYFLYVLCECYTAESCHIHVGFLGPQ